MSIQRYKYAVLPGGMDPHPDGDWVTYADHVAAYDDAKFRAYVSGTVAMRAACVAVMEDLPPWWQAKPGSRLVRIEDVITVLSEVRA